MAPFPGRSTSTFGAILVLVLLVFESDSYLVQHNSKCCFTRSGSGEPPLSRLGSSGSSRYGRFMFSSKKPEVAEDAKQDQGEKEGFEVKTWNPLRLLVLRLGLTEPMATSPLNYGNYDGVFTCAYCGNALFDSGAKYDSGSGWPSFWRTAGDDAVEYKMEFDGRLECRCKNCSSHLGHVFLDGPRPDAVDQGLLESSPESDPRGKTNTFLPRFCINGASLRYTERERQ